MTKTYQLAVELCRITTAAQCHERGIILIHVVVLIRIFTSEGRFPFARSISPR